MRSNPTGIGYRWVVLVVGTTCMFAAIPASPPGFSPYMDTIMAELGVSRSALTASFLLGTVLSGFLMSGAGRWIDRFGSRAMVSAGLLALGAALAAFSLLDRIAHLGAALPGGTEVFGLVLLGFGFLVLRVLGIGLIMNGCRTMIFRWFTSRRGLAASISGSAMSLLFSVSPLVLNQLILLVGWRGSFVLVGLTAATVFLILVRVFFHDSPEAAGVVADPEPGAPEGMKLQDMTAPEARATPAFWIFSLGLAMNALAGTGTSMNIVSIGVDLGGLGKEQSLALFLPSSLFNIVTIFLLGAICERIRMRWIHCFMMICQAAAMVGLLHLDSTAGQWLFISGSGMAWGAFGILLNVPWPRFFGRRHLGAITGSVSTAVVIARGLGPLVLGPSVDIDGTYAPALAVLIIGLAATALAGVFAVNPQRQLLAEASGSAPQSGEQDRLAD